MFQTILRAVTLYGIIMANHLVSSTKVRRVCVTSHGRQIGKQLVTPARESVVLVLQWRSPSYGYIIVGPLHVQYIHR